MRREYTFSEKVWKYQGPAAWYFVTLPEDIAREVDFYFGSVKRGWGSLPVVVLVGVSQWKTSIFTDKKSESYLLPLKASVRKAEGLVEGEEVRVRLVVDETI